jgi:thioredoxin reductase (NADPH)
VTADRAVVVVGSGAAGLTSAIYLGKAGVPTLVIEGDPFNSYDMPGGQLMLTETVDNVPGLLNGTSGPELMNTMREQAEGVGIEFVTELVTQVDFSTSERVLRTESTEYVARVVIIASGARPRLLELEGEEPLLGHGVSVCAMCDGPLFAGRTVAVIGGGDTAFEEALLLSRVARTVTIFYRGSKPEAAPALQEKVAHNPAINVRLEAEVVGYEISDRLTSIQVCISEKTEAVPVEGLFLAIGRTPNTELFRKWVDSDPAGYIRTSNGTATSLDGVFSCGECQDPRYRQFATAVGSGCMAGIDATQWLSTHQ